MDNPLVVGYKGEIGSFILNGLLRILPKANSIWCVDVNNSDDEVLERIEKSDVIFLCVPIRDTVKWLQNYYLYLKDKIIIEQTSLKEPVFDSEVVKNLNVIPMHILFRPSATPNLGDRKVGLFLENDDLYITEVIKVITQAQVIWFRNVSHHDKEMAVQQALVHRTLLALGEIISASDTSTYVGSRVKELCARIKKGDKELYSVIQSNEYIKEGVELLTDGLNNFDIGEYFS